MGCDPEVTASWASQAGPATVTHFSVNGGPLAELREPAEAGGLQAAPGTATFTAG